MFAQMMRRGGWVVFLLWGCGEEERSAGRADASAPLADGAVVADADAEAGPLPDATVGADAGPQGVVGACTYTNPFSRGAECKAYTGVGWTSATAEADCAAVAPRTAGMFEAGGTCAFEAQLGTCAVGDPAADGYILVSAGADAAQCSLARIGCETFAGGRFTNGGVCDVEGPACPEAPEPTGTAFVQPYVDCRDPAPGEGGGPICTPVVVSGCTEPGLHFAGQASCADVRTQRPYVAAFRAVPPDPADPRLQDDAWLAEASWVKAQADACACGCCHTGSDTLAGASSWDTEAGPLWIDQVSDPGLAMLAGWVPSEAFGAVEVGRNNGFDRFTTGLPTTDIERMQRFLVGELERRGRTLEDAAGYEPFGGPLYTQSTFVPEACPEGVGVGSDGVLVWGGDAARYVYVMDAGAANPGVPPNLDVPEGTRWLIDVPPDARAMACGMTYGEVPAGARQRVPEAGVPAALEPGTAYYLYVLRDIALPVTRCVFTYEGP